MAIIEAIGAREILIRAEIQTVKLKSNLKMARKHAPLFQAEHQLAHLKQPNFVMATRSVTLVKAF